MNTKQNNAIFKEYREKRGMTQEELAEKLGVIPRHLQKIEAGDRNITLSSFLILIRELDMDKKDVSNWLIEEQKRVYAFERRTKKS